MTTMVARATRKARRPLEFTPVPRAPTRADGWSADKQRGFIAALAACGSVRLASEAVGMAWGSVYKLRQARGAESFVAAWDAAIRGGARNVRDVLIDHTINGIPEEVWHGGKKVGVKRVFRHQAMQWLLKEQLPGEFGGGRPFGWAAKSRLDGHCCDAARDAAEGRQRVRITLIEVAAQFGIAL